MASSHRHIWCLHPYIKLLLLTAPRKDEVSRMSWREIDKEAVWAIPAERYKTNRPNLVPLSLAARAIIKAQPRTSDYVIVGRTGKTPFSGFSKAKAALDRGIGLDAT